MKAKIVKGILKAVELPNAYKGIKNVQNGYAQMTELHELDGFFEIMKPDLQANERLGKLIKIDNYYTYEIVEITQPTQEQLDEQKKQEQYDELQPTDWYFIRLAETGIEVPFEILEQRRLIREKYI